MIIKALQLNKFSIFVYSHVHAAYASFLWETEDDDDDVDCKVPPKDFDAKPPHFHEGAVAFARGQAVN
jgi:hypothetical protein